LGIDLFSCYKEISVLRAQLLVSTSAMINGRRYEITKRQCWIAVEFYSGKADANQAVAMQATT
jgi:hypothetical protein